MKKKSLKIVLILFVLICACFVTTKTYAAATEPPLYKHNLIWNIASYYYYIDSSAANYATPIANAAYNWVYTGYGWNNLYPNTRTTNITDSACDFFAFSDSSGDSNAYTTFFKRSNGHTGTVSQVRPVDSSDWLFNEVHINSAFMKKKSSTQQQATICHEFGHCFRTKTYYESKQYYVYRCRWKESI